MMQPKHAAILMFLCPGFTPGEVMRGAMFLAGLLGEDGKLTREGRAHGLRAARLAKTGPANHDECDRWEECRHENMHKRPDDEECPDCGATWTWLKAQE